MEYLFTVSPSDIIKFDSTEFITVPNSWGSSQDSQIKACSWKRRLICKPESNKTCVYWRVLVVDANGLSQEVDIIGDGEGAKQE